MAFSPPIKKDIENWKTIFYKTKFIDGVRFMASSLSSLADNFAERHHKDKCQDC